LEEDGVLHPDNEVDIYCLHICFIHLIQKDLDSFRSAWNEHKIRTANNMSPKQLFIDGLHKLTVLASQTSKIFTELQQVSRKLISITSCALLRDNFIFIFQEENWKPEANCDTITAPLLEVEPNRCPIPEDYDAAIRKRFNEENVTKRNVRETYLYLRETVKNIMLSNRV
jgi:hypothetical protein